MIETFTGDYRWLSNFAKVHIKYKGRVYPSVENAYMSAKNESYTWKYFCEVNAPNVVKKASRDIYLVKDWDNIKRKVMWNCLLRKYEQEPYRTMLIETGDQDIMEGNYWGDRFWGVDLKCNPPEGKNTLGLMIMLIRERLSNGDL